MEIYFESSGSLAGINDNVILDTDLMSSDESKYIQKLITDSNFF